MNKQEYKAPLIGGTLFVVGWILLVLALYVALDELEHLERALAASAKLGFPGLLFLALAEIIRSTSQTAHHTQKLCSRLEELWQSQAETADFSKGGADHSQKPGGEAAGSQDVPS